MMMMELRKHYAAAVVICFCLAALFGNRRSAVLGMNEKVSAGEEQ